MMSDRALLQEIAQRAMRDRGLWPEYSPRVMREAGALQAATPESYAGHLPVRDLRGLLWCSIDNDDSRDLDQLTVAEPVEGGGVRIRVAIADVDAVVLKGSAVDRHAAHNTTSVYPPGHMYAMLPERLSTDITSLNPDVDRLAMVISYDVAPDGSLGATGCQAAWVRNHAKLAYNALGAWLEGRGDPPAAMMAVPGLAENIRQQDETAQRLRALRVAHGALQFQTIEGEILFEGDRVSGIAARGRNRATDLIEDLMIAANEVTARYLEQVGSPSLRRVVRTPARWDRIVALAAEHHYQLPEQPDARALDAFLMQARQADPLRFPDLSLAVIKLLGSGEYVAALAGEDAPGHFGLAVQDYAHSTAPNRRYPDVITQRLLKAALAGRRPPYSDAELEALAEHCTEQEDQASKVERQTYKSAAALLLRERVGETFAAIVTGAADKGSWVRLLDLPVEGKLVRGTRGVDVGDRIHVELLAVDVQRGFIDFGQVVP
ncbi:MAG: RNB domain-containing ribonuclease [Anaerolineae bacterium]|jgi:VacB/RNase II family 3'-5' exoribonuclease|nr:RNB domain-containing ribonuclease [Chloroflexota bacterium]